MSKRWALAGAATWRARAMALSRSPMTLFIPAMTRTLSGPKHRAATRLALPSMFTSWPSAEMALLLMMKVPQVRAWRIRACFSSGVLPVSRSMS